MIDPIGVCPHCRSRDMILEVDKPAFEDCEYICIYCDWRGEGRQLKWEETLTIDEDEDDEY